MATMTSPFASGTLIRSQAAEFFTDTEDDWPDATLEGYATNNADPIIVGMLSSDGMDVSVVVTTDGLLISLASAKIAAGEAMKGGIAKRAVESDDEDMPNRLVAEGKQIITDIMNGDATVEGLSPSSGQSAFQVDSDPEDMGEDAMFVGPPENWEHPIETRQAQ